MNKKIPKIISLILLFVIITTSACDNTEFKEQIGEFQTAMSESRTSIEPYYLEMNQFERDLYLLQRELDKNLRMAFIP